MLETQEKIINDLELRLFESLFSNKSASIDAHRNVKALLEDVPKKLGSEKIALQQRIAKQLKALTALDDVTQQLARTVSLDLEYNFSNLSQILNDISLSSREITLLETLSKPNYNIESIRQPIENMPWLVKDISKQASTKGLTDLKLLLTSIGADKLCLFIPYFCLKNYLHFGEKELTSNSKKVWRFSIMTSIAAKELAKLHNRNIPFIYSAALFLQFSSASIATYSNNSFEKQKNEWLEQALSVNDLTIVDATKNATFPTENITNFLNNHVYFIRWNQFMSEGTNSSIMELYKEIDSQRNYKLLSPNAKVLVKSNGYAMLLHFKEQNKISEIEEEQLLKYFEFQKDELDALSKINFRKLNLTLS